MSDDLLDLLGVVLPAPKTKAPVECGQKPPRAAPVRHTEWNNNTSFQFGGYLARVTQHCCSTCDAVTETLEGVFIEELHTSGTRRLTILAKGAQWPAGVEHRLEVTQASVEVCAQCVRGLGFSREQAAPGKYALVLRE
jgi:hypothetical protein